MRKTIDTAILSLAVGCLVIGIYELVAKGVAYAYLWLMVCFFLWFWFTFRKKNEKAAEEPSGEVEKNIKTKVRKPHISKSSRKRK